MSQLVSVHDVLKILTIFFWMHFIVCFWGWFQFQVSVEDKKITRESAYSWCSTIFSWVFSHPMPGSLLIFPLLSCNCCCSFELHSLMPKVNDKKLVSLWLEPNLPFRESTVPEIWIFKAINCSNCMRYWEQYLALDSKNDNNSYKRM